MKKINQDFIDGRNHEKNKIIELIDIKLKELLIIRPTNLEQTAILKEILKQLNPDYKYPSRLGIKEFREIFYADKLPNLK